MKVAAFALVPGVCEILCAPYKSEISVFPNPMELLQPNPTGLQSQMLWGLLFPVSDPHTGGPDMGLRTLTPVGNPL